MSVQIECSAGIVRFARPLFNHCMDDHEELKFIHFDKANRVVNIHHAGAGTDSGVLCDVRDVVRQALMIIIMIHNHPSGNKLPSRADIELSLKLKKGLKFFNIEILDSLILTKTAYYSLVDEGKL